VIGCSLEADISLDDGTVSVRHAKIKKEDNNFVIYDLASTNGVFVNEKKVFHSILRDRDEVRLGNTLLIFKNLS